MLTFKKRLIRPPNVDLDRLKEAIMGDPDALAKVAKVKSFLKSRLNGKSVKESKALAGIKSGTVAKIVAEPVAEILLQDLLKDSGFGNMDIKNKLKQLWDAKDPIVSKFGIIGEKPNWEAQHKALDQVLQLRGFKKKQADDVDDRPVSVVFNVMSVPEPVKVVEVKNESNGKNI